MIKHRPPQDLLFDYASGSLPEAVSLAVATHVALCEESQREIAAFEAVGGAMIGDIAGEPLGAGALDAVLEKIEAAPSDLPSGRETESLQVDEATREVLPSPLWPYVAGGLGALKWRRKGSHVEVAQLSRALQGFRGGLLRIKAGQPIPIHTHVGSEYTVLLSGSYTDDGERYGRGDFHLADASLEHKPVADPDRDCLCLAILDAPFKLTGPIGRYINPFIRI